MQRPFLTEGALFLQEFHFLREVKRTLRIVLHKESPYDLINFLSPIAVTLQT